MKRTLSFLLALLTVFSLFPVETLAAALPGALDALSSITETAVTEEPTLPPETQPTETEPTETEATETEPQETEPEVNDPQETVPDGFEPDEIIVDEQGREMGVIRGTYQPNQPTLNGEELDNDALFAGYVESVFYETHQTPFATGSFSAGAKLSGDELRAYNAMVPLVRYVANGQRASTKFTLGATSTDVQVVFQQYYWNFDEGAVLDALWQDLAYEMYWAWWRVVDYEVYYYTANNLLADVIYYIAVDPRLRSDSSNYFRANTYLTSSASTAVNNANAIVNKYSGKSSYDKLVGYKKEICALNEYNYPAADDDSYVYRDYGPWQMIYVFDKKSSTNVVCAGYAKAFQYLCDKGGLTCYYVTGITSGEHAWNIVRLQGKNYLVDITNSEPGSWGQNGELFLAGGTGSVANGYTIRNKYGNTLHYSYDQETKDMWGSSVLTLSSTSYVPCTKHSYSTKTTKAATCLAAGTKTHTCKNCGYKYTTTIPKLEHVYKATVLYEPVGDSYGTMQYSCTSGCGVSYTKYFTYANGIYRVAGSDRCQTARYVANRMLNVKGISKFNAIIYANGDNFADALAGSYLSVKKTAPILLYRKSGQAQNLSYIKNTLKSGGTVYILGGYTAVPAAVETELKNAGIKVKRLKGSDRFETNILILKEAGFKGGELLVCTGYNFADSLSASATGKPILLVNNGTGALTSAQKTYLRSLSSKSFTVIGGTGAVSNTLYNTLKSYGSVSRISGSSRYETSVKVAQKYFSSPKGAVLAYAQNFPDGLCGGPLAYMCGMPLILTANGSTSAAESYVDSKGITKGYVLGSNTLISSASAKKIFNLNDYTEIKTN